MAKVALLRALLQADVLITIGNKTSYQLLSKLVEYVCTREKLC